MQPTGASGLSGRLADRRPRTGGTFYGTPDRAIGPIFAWRMARIRKMLRGNLPHQTRRCRPRSRFAPRGGKRPWSKWFHAISHAVFAWLGGRSGRFSSAGKRACDDRTGPGSGGNNRGTMVSSRTAAREGRTAASDWIPARPVSRPSSYSAPPSHVLTSIARFPGSCARPSASLNCCVRMDDAKDGVSFLSAIHSLFSEGSRPRI